MISFFKDFKRKKLLEILYRTKTDAGKLVSNTKVNKNYKITIMKELCKIML